MAGARLLDALFREPRSRPWDRFGFLGRHLENRDARRIGWLGRARGADRLSRPLALTEDIPGPFNADWVWRPQLWRGEVPIADLHAVPSKTRLGHEVTVFHDCETSEVRLYQPMNQCRNAVGMDISRFDGTFLSVVVDLPGQALKGLKRTHLLGLTATIKVQRPVKVYARINVRHGPNTEQIVRELPMQDDRQAVEFDLAYTDLNEKRIESAWLDLIFAAPDVNRIALHDLTLSRRPRAAF